jgi:hypothetical protein
MYFNKIPPAVNFHKQASNDAAKGLSSQLIDLGEGVFHDTSILLTMDSLTKKGYAIKKWLRGKKLDAIIGASNQMPYYLRSLGIQIGKNLAYVDLLISSIHRNERGVPKIPLTIQVEGNWQDRGSTPDKT